MHEIIQTSPPTDCRALVVCVAANENAAHATDPQLSSILALNDPAATDCINSKRVAFKKLPRRISASHPCSTSSIIVENGILSAVVPEPGNGVTVFGMLPEGAGEVEAFSLQRQADGALNLELAVSESAPQAAVAAAAGECSDQGNLLWPYSINSNRTWKYSSNVAIPSGMTQANVTSTITGSLNNWLNMFDNCNFPDQIPYTYTYAGTTASGPEISGNTCGTTDGVSEVGFGVANGSLALTCTFNSGGVITSADTKIDNTYSWFTGAVPSGCSGKYSLANVMTHEVGHQLGFGDITSSATLTMYATSLTCSTIKTTLGCGDYLAARVKYGTTGSC